MKECLLTRDLGVIEAIVIYTSFHIAFSVSKKSNVMKKRRTVVQRISTIVTLCL